jgi:hypothetical protein
VAKGVDALLGHRNWEQPGRGQCYDVLRFLPIIDEKIGVFSSKRMLCTIGTTTERRTIEHRMTQHRMLQKRPNIEGLNVERRKSNLT